MNFVNFVEPWSGHSGPWWAELLVGNFCFTRTSSEANNFSGSRL